MFNFSYIYQLGENFFSCDEIENLSDISAEFYDCPNDNGTTRTTFCVKQTFMIYMIPIINIVI